MKHAATRALFDYWNRQRGLRPAPARSDIDPGDIRHILGDTFMLAEDFAAGIRFRLAGTRICALFAREIKGEAFASLWSQASHEQFDTLLAAVLGERIGVVAGVSGRTQDGTEAELEMLLLPLAVDGGTRVRALGALAPLSPLYWLGERPVIELELGTFRHVGGEQSEGGKLSPGKPDEEPRTRRGLLVYSGGRELPDGKPTG